MGLCKSEKQGEREATSGKQDRNGLQDATPSFVGILNHPSLRECWDKALNGTLLPLVRISRAMRFHSWARGDFTFTEKHLVR